MAKLKYLLSVILVLTQYCVRAQEYHLYYSGTDVDSSVLRQKTGLQTVFSTRAEASLYVFKLPALLQAKGFIGASLDSVSLDTAWAKVRIFLGEQYHWARIRLAPQDAGLLDSVQWNDKTLEGPVDFQQLEARQKKILDHLEATGHPFGQVFLDSIEVSGNQVMASLHIRKGPFYHIDSIRVYGDVKLSNLFLQRYLDIRNGSPYNKYKLDAVSRKIKELTYVQEERLSDLSLLGTGSVLNLYLKPRKSSQVNALVGFLPNTDQVTGNRKLLLTVDANILLRNALGSGETLGLVWQQLQKGSPRLNLLFDQPYAFHSPFGLNFSLDMYRRDSTYLNLNMNLGTSYRMSDRQTGSLFLQRQQTIVSGVNTALVLQTRQLPREADVSSLNLGLSYAFNNTDYRFNPKKGNDWVVTATAGTKNIKKNAQILDLKDPADPGFSFDHLYDTVKPKVYQFRLTTSAAHFLPLGSQSTLKLGLNAGIYQSGSYYTNELFRIGGYKLLRGFDEESQFVSRYAIGTVEYRYLIGLNSALFTFLDGGYGKQLQQDHPDHAYLGTGLGMSFETKAGIIQLAWAVGRREDSPLNLRQSKIHLGFASFF